MALFDALALQAAHFQASLDTPIGRLSLGAAAVGGLLVVVSAFVRTMIPLRWLAVGSNVFFVVYGLTHPFLDHPNFNFSIS